MRNRMTRWRDKKIDMNDNEVKHEIEDEKDKKNK